MFLTLKQSYHFFLTSKYLKYNTILKIKAGMPVVCFEKDGTVKLSSADVFF